MIGDTYWANCTPGAFLDGFLLKVLKFKVHVLCVSLGNKEPHGLESKGTLGNLAESHRIHGFHTALRAAAPTGTWLLDALAQRHSCGRSRGELRKHLQSENFAEFLEMWTIGFDI